jgi:hypothetical protein
LACAHNNFKTTSPFSEQSNYFLHHAAVFGEHKSQADDAAIDV